MSSLSEPKIKEKLVFSNEEKKKRCGTIWSEEDDILLLKGMIDYEVLKKSNPNGDMGKFLDFVKPCLHFNVQRKQLTDRLWRLKSRYINSHYDISKPHHANLFELSKMIKSWGHHANVSVDGEKSGNVVISDGQNGESVGVDNVVVGDGDVGKSEKISKNKEKGKLVTNVGVDDDVHVKECSKKKKKKKKRKLVSKDSQNVEEINVGLDDANGGECSKEVKKKGKVLTCDGQNGQEDAVVVEYGKSEQVVKDKNKGNDVTCGDQYVEKDNVVVDEFDADGSQSAQVVKGRNKGKDVFSDGRDDEENHMVVDEVYGGESDQVVKGYDLDGNKFSKLVKNKKMIISDGQNVEEVNAVVDVQSAKKIGKKRIKVLGNENVPREVNKKESEGFTSIYPELTNMLELETLSRMPEHIKKKTVMDTINFMGREKANELEEKLADFRLMEMELNAKKLELTSKHINMILEAMTDKFKP